MRPERKLSAYGTRSAASHKQYAPLCAAANHISAAISHKGPPQGGQRGRAGPRAALIHIRPIRPWPGAFDFEFREMKKSGQAIHVFEFMKFPLAEFQKKGSQNR